MDLLSAETRYHNVYIIMRQNSVRYSSTLSNDHTLLIALRVHNNRAVGGCNVAASDPYVVVAEDCDRPKCSRTSCKSPSIVQSAVTNAVSTDTVLYTTGPHCHGTLQLLDGTSWRPDVLSLRYVMCFL